MPRAGLPGPPPRGEEVAISSFVAVVLPDERRARQAAHRLEALHEAGSIALYGMARLVRARSGRISVRLGAAPGPLGEATAQLAKALAERAGAPEPAMAEVPDSPVGLAAFGLGPELLDEILAVMPPGSAAVISEIGEHWLAPVDASMAALGGVMVRRYRTDMSAQLLRQEVELLEAELRALEQEAELTTGEAERALRGRATVTRTRLGTAALRARHLKAALERESELRMAALLAQMERATAELEQRKEAEAKIGRAIVQARMEAAARLRTLEEVLALTNTALDPDQAG